MAITVNISFFLRFWFISKRSDGAVPQTQAIEYWKLIEYWWKNHESSTWYLRYIHSAFGITPHEVFMHQHSKESLNTSHTQASSPSVRHLVVKRLESEPWSLGRSFRNEIWDESIAGLLQDIRANSIIFLFIFVYIISFVGFSTTYYSEWLTSLTLLFQGINLRERIFFVLLSVKAT